MSFKILKFSNKRKLKYIWYFVNINLQQIFFANYFFRLFLFQSSEYEEYTDSEEEANPRLKPVFVRK